MLSFLPTLGGWVWCRGAGAGGRKCLQVLYGGPDMTAQEATDRGSGLGM